MTLRHHRSEIESMVAARVPQAKIAAIYGVHQSAISLFLSRDRARRAAAEAAATTATQAQLERITQCPHCGWTP